MFEYFGYETMRNDQYVGPWIPFMSFCGHNVINRGLENVINHSILKYMRMLCHQNL